MSRNLAFPYGVLVLKDGKGIVVAESWRHRLLGIPGHGGGAPVPILAKLSGYPARLTPAADGGAWLALTRVR